MSGEDRFDRAVERWDRIYSDSGPAWIRVWNRMARANVRHRFERTFALTKTLDGQTVLDVGAGTGRYAIRALDLGAKRVVAVDPSAEMCRHLLAVRDGLNDGARLEIVNGNLDQLDVAKLFDLVIVNGVLDYANDPEVLLAQAWSLCAGRLVATVPDRCALRAPIRRGYWRLRGVRINYFSRSDLIGSCARLGLRRCKIERIGPIFFIMATSNSIE